VFAANRQHVGDILRCMAIFGLQFALDNIVHFPVALGVNPAVIILERNDIPKLSLAGSMGGVNQRCWLIMPLTIF
jgi:hypothetical protein